MGKAVTWARLADAYLDGRPCTPRHAAAVRRAVGGLPAVTVQALNRHIQARLQTQSTATVRTERSIALSVWLHGYQIGLIDQAPRGVVKFRQRRPPTRAWTQEQLRTAVAGTQAYAGVRMRWSGADKGRWLLAWILLGYESGSRLGDLWQFTGDDLDGDVLRWTQSKTGDPICRHLSPACLAACRRMLEDSPDGRILGWACGRRQASRAMRAFLDGLGLPGTSKFLRRSGATHIEMEQPGKASLHLGHRTPNLASQAYIDWGQVRQRAPSTPVLLDMEVIRGIAGT